MGKLVFSAWGVAAPFFGIGVVVAVACSLFASLGGANWFAWHPVLMTSAFAFLMPVGRLAYIGDRFGICLERREDRRNVHRIFMILALASMLGGYLAVFEAHWPKKIFFGYDFKHQTWAPTPKVIHVWIGYTAIFLSLYQALTGMAKIQSLQQGRRTFPNHGLLGKVIMMLGLVAILLAVYFWTWTPRTKGFVGGLATASVLSSFVLPLWWVEDELSPLVEAPQAVA